MTNPLPYSIGFVCGFLSALFALLIEYILRHRTPHDQPQQDAAPDAATHSPTEAEPVVFDTRMDNFEWADAQIEELRRKIESDTGRKE
jgi:hypothetical protein